MPLSTRSTADVVILMGATVLALVVLLTGAGIFLVMIYLPDRDMHDAVTAYSNFVGTITGAFLGYAAGRTRRPVIDRRDHP